MICFGLLLATQFVFWQISVGTGTLVCKDKNKLAIFCKLTSELGIVEPLLPDLYLNLLKYRAKAHGASDKAADLCCLNQEWL